MYGHENCRYYNDGVTRCLDCDQPIAITYRCPHGVTQEKELPHKCNPPSVGKHRKKK